MMSLETGKDCKVMGRWETLAQYEGGIDKNAPYIYLQYFVNVIF